MNNKKVFSLEQLTNALQKTIREATGDQLFWVKAEIAQVKYAGSGHAYLELVELRNNVKVASMSAVMWQHDVQLMRKKMSGDFDNIVSQGQEMVCLVAIEFHAVYGLKLRISDIDLSYTLGALEKRKAETLERLKKEGLLTRNRAIPLPRIMQNIALITAADSAACEDFRQHILQNEHQYRFHIELFPSMVQGDQAPKQLLRALQNVDTHAFDAVVFIRGGGSALDLDAFNDYALCAAAANFPLPVLTGIGHETDLSILDMVAGSPHKTPTAIADFLIDRMYEFESEMARMMVQIARSSAHRIKQNELVLKNFYAIVEKYPVSFCQRQRGQLHDRSVRLLRLTEEVIHAKQIVLRRTESNTMQLAIDKVRRSEPKRIHEASMRLSTLFNHKLTLYRQRMQQLESSVALLHPRKTLARGFSISRVNGESLTDVSKLNIGDNITTELLNGQITSTVTDIKKTWAKKNPPTTMPLQN